MKIRVLSRVSIAAMTLLVMGCAVSRVGPSASPTTSGAPTTTVPSQPWRLLTKARTTSDAAYQVQAATNDVEFRTLWTASGSSDPRPAIDFSHEVAVSFAQGVGSSCPDLNLDDVKIDTQSRIVYSTSSNPLGDIPCTADLASAVVFVVAIENEALPPRPFQVLLDKPGSCAGLTCVSVTVSASSSPTTPFSPVPSQTPNASTGVGPLSKDDAIARVVAFVDEPTLTSDLAVDGPNAGASWRWYDVTGKHLIASVNADTGDVIGLTYLDAHKPISPPPASDDAVSAAEKFLADHSISSDGMTRSVQKLDHGESWEWVVTWTQSANGVTLPNSREVGVDESGRVWRFAATTLPVGSLPPAQIDEASAEAAAVRAAFPDTPQTQIDSAELKVKVDADGRSRLVWEIAVTGWIPVGSATMPIDHALVEVDAQTGVSTIIGRG